jgi:hypothetical protein
MPTLSPILPEATVLLVLLPLAPGSEAAAARASLGALQQQLGPAVRVLAIDEASHPAVVRSFGPAALPASVLVHRGVELWRQPGLPAAEAVANLLQAPAELPYAPLTPAFDINQVLP